jgi:DNA (cytosine-5)-methyltransferase 1
MSETKPIKPKRVAELFAGVGGFRLGLEAVGWEVVWSNQWEPSTKRQHASEIYQKHFTNGEHVGEDIKVVLDQVEAGKRVIPPFELLVGGFPCQDYSVASTLSQAAGIQGKKGVLWWEINRMLQINKPKYIFLENVDRLLKSPANQRGRDFAIMLACLSDLGYLVEWRVVNAADYGFPQKRRRVFIVGRKLDSYFAANPEDIIFREGIISKALPVQDVRRTCKPRLFDSTVSTFQLEGHILNISNEFGKDGKKHSFENTGLMYDRKVWTTRTIPVSDGQGKWLQDILQPDDEVARNFWIPDSQLAQWKYLKGAKKEERTEKSNGFSYFYTEGAIPFPDNIEGPSRTILTGEGGSTPSRFKHIILCSNGKFRRLTPVELERLDGFPDNWTEGLPDTKRAFLLGNALVVGIITKIGNVLFETDEQENRKVDRIYEKNISVKRRNTRKSKHNKK